MTALPAPRLHFLIDGAVETTSITSLPDGGTCGICDDSLALARVYGSDQPSWRVHQPFEYAECCLDCAAVCAAVAVLERSDLGSAVRVELAADVWMCRDDSDGC